MTAPLEELLDRVEKATGADRELDARLHVALFPEEPGMVHPGSPNGLRGSTHGPIGGMDWTAWDHLSLARGSDLGMVANHHHWPDHTRSLDAALALVERVLPGWDFAVKRFGLRANAEVFENNGKGYEYASGATPAVALLAALLKALIAQEKQP